MEWGDVLRVSQRGMWASRGFLWEEAARNIACLLACPAAWDGDHFLQVISYACNIITTGSPRLTRSYHTLFSARSSVLSWHAKLGCSVLVHT